MDTTELAAILEAARARGDDSFDPYDPTVVAALDAQGVPVTHIRTILRFMEQHDAIDFGSPGPLVHWMERGEHLPELLASLRRQPTTHTVWMPNRVLNATTDERARSQYPLAMTEAAAHPLATASTKEECARFLEFQGPSRKA